MYVYVITNPELGWDCVCGVVEADKDMSEDEAITKHLMDNYSDDEIEEILADGSYIAHYMEVNS